MAFNNLRWLTCHKTKPNHIYLSIYLLQYYIKSLRLFV